VSLKAPPRFISPSEVHVGEDKVVCHPQPPLKKRIA